MVQRSWVRGVVAALERGAASDSQLGDTQRVTDEQQEGFKV